MGVFPRLARRPQILCCALAFALVGGCSRYQLDTAPVHGLVTLDGEPLEGGVVTFLPSRGRAASGLIQPDGSYSLATYVQNPKDGAIVGHHRVSVTPKGSFEGQVEKAPKDRSIPDNYRSPNGSPIEVY